MPIVVFRRRETTYDSARAVGSPDGRQAEPGANPRPGQRPAFQPVSGKGGDKHQRHRTDHAQDMVPEQGHSRPVQRGQDQVHPHRGDQGGNAEKEQRAPPRTGPQSAACG